MLLMRLWRYFKKGRNKSMRKQEDIKSKRETSSLDSDYIYIKITKRKIILAVSTVMVILSIFGISFFLPQSTTQTLVVSSATWLYEQPFVGEYIPAKWLPKSYIISQVLPENGFTSKLAFGDTVVKMVESGVIDKEKIEALYNDRGGIPSDMIEFLTQPSNSPIHITSENSTWLLNLLWPLGLSNYMGINDESPIAGEQVGNFASTGGWTLGKETNGGVYFNSLELVSLTPDQENRVKTLADTIYRPCCDNSTFFQDCNHGSAALGLIQLAVSQGLSDDEIYETLLYFNAFWFPQNYTETALYLQHSENIAWIDVDPKRILSKDYSSISGFMANVHTPAKDIPGLLPEASGGGSCAVS